MSGKRFALCVRNRGAEDLTVSKVYRVLPDRVAQGAGYLRVLDDSGEDYLHRADYFIFVDLPATAKRALAVSRAANGRRRTAAGTRRKSGRRVRSHA
jgi:hypothetical protein